MVTIQFYLPKMENESHELLNKFIIIVNYGSYMLIPIFLRLLYLVTKQEIILTLYLKISL